ncbi:DUF1569 domain-containing protein [Chitinophaga sp. Hz27]|uniref:DUF1569 domain-containing protein n=1 Tax=Chitinophaga sp. Hz27 TaxID=3347169 RepID=UPI0035DF2A0B
MKTTRDAATRTALFHRIQMLDANAVAKWGKMDVKQMLHHCILWEEMALGRIKTKRSFMGRIFGRFVLRNILKDDTRLTRNTPTSPEIKIDVVPSTDFSSQKQHWIAVIEENAVNTDTGFTHPFFGKLTRDQVCQMSYKHTDHHLRQFNG